MHPLHHPSAYAATRVWVSGQGALITDATGRAAANKLEEAILREGPDTVAAFIAEPVQGAGGVIVPPALVTAREPAR